MGYNRVFFPQAALDEWIAEDRVDFNGRELVIKAEGRRYDISEGVRVLGEVTGSSDRHNLVGKVKERFALESAGGCSRHHSSLARTPTRSCRAGSACRSAASWPT